MLMKIQSNWIRTNAIKLSLSIRKYFSLRFPAQLRTGRRLQVPSLQYADKNISDVFSDVSFLSHLPLYRAIVPARAERKLSHKIFECLSKEKRSAVVSTTVSRMPLTCLSTCTECISAWKPASLFFFRRVCHGEIDEGHSLLSVKRVSEHAQFSNEPSRIMGVLSWCTQVQVGYTVNLTCRIISDRQTRQVSCGTIKLCFDVIYKFCNVKEESRYNLNDLTVWLLYILAVAYRLVPMSRIHMSILFVFFVFAYVFPYIIIIKHVTKSRFNPLFTCKLIAASYADLRMYTTPFIILH